MSLKFSEGYSGFPHLVERQMLFHEEVEKLFRKHDTQLPPVPYHFITISRDIGALGGDVARGLESSLHWKVCDREIVDYIAHHNHVLYEIVNQLDTRTQNRIQDSVERLLLMFSARGFSSDAYHESLIQALAALAGKGQCIIVGHGGAHALQEHPGLHVRITGSRSVRIRRLGLRHGISNDKAEKLVRKSDRERADFVQHHFTAERGHENYFHMIFNTDKLPVEDVVASILGVVAGSRGRNGAKDIPHSMDTSRRVS